DNRAHDPRRPRPAGHAGDALRRHAGPRAGRRGRAVQRADALARPVAGRHDRPLRPAAAADPEL
ncbi:MAG: hypothetical protein AVDCRST_MAG04-2941, partial [uncultured Acetobacteraceae bacterium]